MTLNWTALMQSSISSWVALEIWLFCECFHISLGRFAPHIVGIMMGGKGNLVKEAK